MKFVIQRVSRANVSVDGAVIGKINKGFLVLIGIGAEDGKKRSRSSGAENVRPSYL